MDDAIWHDLKKNPSDVPAITNNMESELVFAKMVDGYDEPYYNLRWFKYKTFKDVNGCVFPFEAITHWMYVPETSDTTVKKIPSILDISTNQFPPLYSTWHYLEYNPDDVPRLDNNEDVEIVLVMLTDDYNNELLIDEWYYSEEFNDAKHGYLGFRNTSFDCIKKWMLIPD